MPTKKSRRTKIPEKSAHVRTLRYFVVVSAVVLALVFLHAPMTARASGREKPEVKAYALIFGTVWDPEGHPLYGIKVKIRRSDEKKARWELFSNHTGEFAQRVPAGKADYIWWGGGQGE